MDHITAYGIIDRQRYKSAHTNHRVDFNVSEVNKMSLIIDYLSKNIEPFHWRITEWNNGAVVWKYSFWFFKEEDAQRFKLWVKLTSVEND